MNLEKYLTIFINGTEHKVDVSEVSPNKTLNAFLRSNLHLTGTKRMCLEGGCGACIVAVEQKSTTTKKNTFRAINSCLVPLFLCNGWKITTIEGLSGESDHHYLQKVLTRFNGSQCGFCSPGMVMNMFSLSQNKKTTMKEVENSFGGNICRCTGYRPILAAFKAVCSDASPDLQAKCHDIEDLKVCAKSCLKSCLKTKVNPTYFNLGTHTWIKVSLLSDLLQVLKTFQSSTYMLVAGNTSFGVYRQTEEIQVFVDITSIKELTNYKVDKDCLSLGANSTLTETMQVFEKVAKENEHFSYLQKLTNHIDLIANVPVRNLGTLAGNLMMKYYHHDFPSDIFLIFETIGAILCLIDMDGTTSEIPVKDLLTTSLTGKVLTKIILPKLYSNFKFESYKIMPRAQNAHALVNAGFLLELDSKNIIQSARIVYGCISPSFVHASKTELFLTGRQICQNSTIQEACTILDTELVPHLVPGEPSPAFRKQLAIALFYKYVLSIVPTNLLSGKTKSGKTLLKRSLATGDYDFHTKETLYPVSKPINKVESLAQTSGQAQYIIDMPDSPNQLFGAFVLAKTKPLSVIRKIDSSVVAFFTKDDIPGENNFTPTAANSMFITVKEEIFCSGEVQYFSQPIGLIVATSQELAEKAASLVRVSYNTGKVPLLTIKDVIDSGEIKLEKEIPATKTKGTNTKHVIKGTVGLSWQYHYHMETQCCNVIPTEDGLDMYPSSQWMDLSQTAAAKALNIPINKINVLVRRLGGAFGGKIMRNSLVSCAAALAAHKLKKPVKIWVPFETNMDMFGKRCPVLCNYELACDEKGTIQYLTTTIYTDFGMGGNESNVHFLLETFLESYKTDTWNVKVYSTRTNTPANCFIRAPGSCEGLALIESIMEHAATVLKIDPTDFRMKNLNKEKHELLYKFVKDFQTWADIELRKQEIERFNKENRWKKRGLAVVPMVFPFWMFGNYNVIVSIYKSDGSVAVSHGGVEMGQGINTKAAQVCAYKLGIPLDKVSVKPSNNLVAPNANVSGGSITSETGVLRACEILLKRIEPIRKQLEDSTWEEIVIECYNKYIDLSATYMGSPKELPNYMVYGVCASEIELDVLTGQYVVSRVDLLEDAGTSMNSNIDMGQVEGAFVMGIGYFTSEQILLNENGELLTNRTWNYKPPGAKDIPIDFRIKFPENTPNDVGVLNSKAIGEPPLCLACSVPLAIRNAVASARTDNDPECDQWYPLSGPSTVEETFLNCLHNFENYTL